MKKIPLLFLFFTFFQNSYAQVEPRLIEKKVERFDHDLNRYKTLRKELYDYDHDGKLSRFRNQGYTNERPSGWSSIEYSYDNSNNLTSEIHANYDTLGNASFIYGSFHEYNLQNKITKTTEKRYNPDVDLWITDEWTEYTYDNNGCVASKTHQENLVISSEDISIYTTDEDCRIIKEEFIPDPGYFATFNYDIDNFGSHSTTHHEVSFFNSNETYTKYYSEEIYNEYGDQTISSNLSLYSNLDTNYFYSQNSYYSYVIDPSTNLITSKTLDFYTTHYPNEARFQFQSEYDYLYNCDGTMKLEIRRDLDTFRPVRYQYFYEGQLDCFDFEQDLNITIFPNPSLGQFEIQSTLLTSGNTTLKVFSSDGKLVEERLLLSRDLKQEVNLNYLPNGLFILQFRNGDHVRTTKLVIAK